MISIIVAKASNNVIGKSNDLPWYIPEDLQRFKQLTTGHTIIMGRRTYESIGKPLPNRRNIVVSSQMQSVPGAEVASSLEEALSLSDSNEIFIIGGSQIYQTAIQQNIVDRMYITEVKATIEGDVYFPEYVPTDWTETERIASKNDDFEYDFVTYERKTT